LNIEIIENLSVDLINTWHSKNNVFLCGNGGSSANANHLANDLIYGINPAGEGLNVQSLCANTAINLCLANDIGYENIFAKQLSTLGKKGDILIVLSGSGNSANIANVLKEARRIGLKSYAMLGFDGGECCKLADQIIHFKIHDMQIAEDFQMMIGHILMKQIKKEIAN
jgi:D-sedoheptulose 7-phosphate isomerase